MKQSMPFKRTPKYAVENRSDEWVTVSIRVGSYAMCNTIFQNPKLLVIIELITIIIIPIRI